MSVTFFPSDSGELSPELNVANGNVSIVLDILGFEYDRESVELGTIKRADLQRYLKNVLTADLAGMERETNKVENFYHCGVTVERVKEYQARLIKILAYCVAFEKEFCWG